MLRLRGYTAIRPHLRAATACVNSIIDCLRVTLTEHVTSMFKLSPTCYSDDDGGQSDTHEEIQSSQVAREATLKPGLADGSPSSFSHSHSPRIFSRWTIPSLSDDASPLLQSLSFSLSPPFSPLLFLSLYLPPALIFLSAPPLSLYYSV